MRSAGTASLLALVPVMILGASSATVAQGRGRPARDTTAATADTGPKILTLDKYGPWSRVTNAAIAPDGAWMAHTVQPNDGDATVIVRHLDGDSVYRIPAGAAAEPIMPAPGYISECCGG